MQRNQFEYREAAIEDKQQLKELGLISYGQFYSVLEPQHAVTLKRNLEDEKKLIELLGISKCYVCVYENKVIGMAHIILSGNPWGVFKPEWSYIRMVGVNPNFGGQGIAKKLTGLCIDYAKQKGETLIALHTSEFMDAARHIYESLGFKKIKELDRGYGKRYWLYLLNIE